MQSLSWTQRRGHHEPRLILLFLVMVSGGLSATRSTCPTRHQSHSLVRQSDAPSVRCHCDSDRLDEWEVTCIKDSSFVVDDGSSGTSPPISGSQESFVFKFLNSNAMEITCDHLVPDFKPAMFQGFNVEAVDTFRLSNCPPPAVPLSVIFHRTSLHRLQPQHWSETTNPSSQSDEEVVSEVRSLSIDFSTPTKFNSGHFKSLFNGLDDLEKLTLHNVQIDTQAAIIATSLTAPATIFYSRPKRATADVTASTSSPSTGAADSHSWSHAGIYVTDAPEMSSLSTTAQSFAVSTPSPLLTAETSASTEVLTSKRTSALTSPSPPQFSAVTTDEAIAVEDRITSESESRSAFTQNPPVAMRPVSATDLKLSSMLPKLRSIVITSMFPTGSPANGRFLEKILKDMRQLESVRLTGNNIEELHGQTFSGSALTLKSIYLLGNGLRVLHHRVFSNLVNLQTLDLSNNLLSGLPDGVFSDLNSLTSLRMGKNKFETLAENLLWPMKRLKAIDLNLNRNLTLLPHRLLAGSVELQNFSLTDCDLERLSGDAGSFFAAAPSLQRIEMRGNRLRNLTATGLFASNSQLRRIDFSYNSITSISPAIFSSNSSSITEVNLHGNELTIISSATLDLTQLKNLRNLRLGFNNIVQFSADVLFPLKKLEELDLSRNHLSAINPEHSRLPFGQGSASLRRLNLSRNNLTDFSEFSAIDWSLYLKVAEIDLSRNQLKGPILLPVFYSTASHLILDLSSNEIRSIQMSEILQYEAGVSHEVRDGRMSGSFEERSLNWRPSQVIIRLDGNPLNCDCRLEPFLTYANASSRDLEAALRGILTRVSFDFFSPKLQCREPANLAGLALHKVDPWNLTCLVEDPRLCLSECVCLYRSRDRHAYVNCENHRWDSIPDELLIPNRYRNVTLWENGMQERLAVRMVSLLLSHNAITDITNVQRLQSDQELELLSGEGIYFEVYLDNNRIESVPEDLLKQVKEDEDIGGDERRGEVGVGGHFAVQVLSLRNNYLQRIPVSFLQSIRPSSASSVSQNGSEPTVRLFLGSNPYNCSTDEDSVLPENIADCGLISFKSWLTKNYDIVPDVKEVTCTMFRKDVPSDVPEPIVQIPDADLCPQMLLANEGSLFVLSLLCLFLSLVSLLLCVAYHRNKQTFLAFIYIHVQPVFVCLHFSEQDLDEDKLYDAFVSYSSSDRDIVMAMIAELEGPNDSAMDSISFLKQQTGTPSVHEGSSDQIVPEHSVTCKRLQTGRHADAGSYFNLCIHERDWLPGNLISWNIVNSVQNSRRTILILSKEFIRSIWFQVEFHTAYYQMLEDKMDRLIVVVKGDLPPKEEMDKDLVFLLTTKTYLTWGEKWFWEKLRYALPHKKGAERLPVKLSEPKDKANYSVAMNGRTKQSKADLMKQYVDQTISDHFQLQQKNPDRLFDPSPCDPPSHASSPKRGHVNQSFVSESEA